VEVPARLLARCHVCRIRLSPIHRHLRPQASLSSLQHRHPGAVRSRTTQSGPAARLAHLHRRKRQGHAAHGRQRAERPVPGVSLPPRGLACGQGAAAVRRQGANAGAGEVPRSRARATTTRHADRPVSRRDVQVWADSEIPSMKLQASAPAQLARAHLIVVVMDQDKLDADDRMGACGLQARSQMPSHGSCPYPPPLAHAQDKSSSHWVKLPHRVDRPTASICPSSRQACPTAACQVH